MTDTGEALSEGVKVQLTGPMFGLNGPVVRVAGPALHDGFDYRVVSSAGYFFDVHRDEMREL